MNIINISYDRIDIDNTFQLIVHILHYRILQMCVRRPFWTRRKISCLRQRYCLNSSFARRSALSPYRNKQVTMTMSGRSRHLHSNAKEVYERM